MTAHLLVVGDPAFDSAELVHDTIQHAYLALRPAGQILLLTVTDSMPEKAAIEWWQSHGLLVQLVHRHPNKYITLNNVIRDVVPDLSLVFGSNNFCLTAVARCKNGGIRYAHIP